MCFYCCKNTTKISVDYGSDLVYNIFTESSNGTITMITQATKSQFKTEITPILKSFGVKGSLSIYNKELLVLKIKGGDINFIENYNNTVPVYKKAYVIMTIESFNKHLFTGDALKCVNSLFNIAKRYVSSTQNFVIDYTI